MTMADLGRSSEVPDAKAMDAKALDVKALDAKAMDAKTLDAKALGLQNIHRPHFVLQVSLNGDRLSLAQTHPPTHPFTRPIYQPHLC